MNLWDSPGVKSADIIGGMKNEQTIIKQAASNENQNMNFSATLLLGLVTEVDCFKAIKELGDAKFYLKNAVAELAKKGPERRAEMEKAALAVQQVHNNQLIIINDVCKRFGVIHPELLHPTEEMLKTKTLYWDWYKDQHKKVYGTFPEIINKTKPNV